jgi:hypothetical protein
MAIKWTLSLAVCFHVWLDVRSITVNKGKDSDGVDI